MNLLLASLFNFRELRRSGARVFALVDSRADVSPDDVFRYTRPWKDRMTVVGAEAVEPQSAARVVREPRVKDADVVLCISGDAVMTHRVRVECQGMGSTCVTPALPPADSRELALLQEVLHHDFELGGLNEWSDVDPQFSAAVLRMLSTTHCRRAFPRYASAALGDLLRRGATTPLRALDVGCGAVSRLRWGTLNGLLTVTGVDPLLDMYAVVRERHGYGSLPSIACDREIAAGAEFLLEHVETASIDFAYCSNALDHTEDPAVVIESIAAVLRPGGLLAIDVYTREGSRENWWQLHQFDMYVDEHDDFMAERRDGSVIHLAPPGCGLTVREVAARDETTALIFERTETALLRRPA